MSRAPASRSSTTLLAVFLLGTVVLSCGLAVQAYQADRSHRTAAESVLVDYAGIAALEYGRTARADLSRIFDVAFDDVPRRFRPGRLPDLVEVRRELDDAADAIGCACTGLQRPAWIFRGDARTGSVDREWGAPGDRERAGTVAGPEPARTGGSSTGREGPGRGDDAPGSRMALARVLEHLSAGEDARYGLLALPSSHDVAAFVLFAAVFERDAGPAAVYGVVLPRAAVTELARHWYDRHEPLPPSMRGREPTDSLVRVDVSDGAGRAVFRSHSDPIPERHGLEPLGPGFGDLVVRASIRREAADLLIIGGLPSSRLPFSLGLLGLTLAVGLAGLVEVRRHDQLARLREDFVSGVSHELRTPLTQIRMLAELQADGKLRSEHERLRASRVMAREAGRLTQMVENLLHFGRLRDPGPRGPAAGPTSVRACVDAVAETFRPLIAARSAELEVAVPHAHHVLAHRSSVRQILGNLLDNALKYGPTGQTVRIGSAADGDIVRLSVEDQGPGIPREARSLVWEPYRRLPRDVTGNRPGSGVGLAVVRALAADLGGRARVADAPGGGARFVVELPAAPRGAPDDGEGGREREPADAAHAGGGPHGAHPSR